MGESMSMHETVSMRVYLSQLKNGKHTEIVELLHLQTLLHNLTRQTSTDLTLTVHSKHHRAVNRHLTVC